jgi:hypothetical protein
MPPGETVDQVEYYRSPLLRSSADGYDELYVSASELNGSDAFRPAVVGLGPDGSIRTRRTIEFGIVVT